MTTDRSGWLRRFARLAGRTWVWRLAPLALIVALLLAIAVLGASGAIPAMYAR